MAIDSSGLTIDEDATRQDFEAWFKGVHGFTPWKNGLNYAANAQPAWEAWVAASQLSHDRHATIRAAKSLKSTAETMQERSLADALQDIARYPIKHAPAPASRLNRIQQAYNEGYEAALEETAEVAREALKELSKTRFQ